MTLRAGYYIVRPQPAASSGNGRLGMETKKHIEIALRCGMIARYVLEMQTTEDEQILIIEYNNIINEMTNLKKAIQQSKP